MLRIDARELRDEELLREGVVSAPAESWPDVGGEFVGGVTLAYRVARGATGDLRVIGRLSATLRFACRRCLQPVDEQLEVDFDVVYRPEAGERGPEEVVYELTQAGMLDLTSMLREEMLLALPAWSQCRPECRGLCPRCGVDRNVEDCDCTLEERDPRWDALRAMLGT